MLFLCLVALVGSALASNVPGPRDCITRPGQWGPCSASCGGGRRSRSLIIVQEPSGYGAKCIYAISDCITRPGQWGPCSASCGGGRRSRSLIIVQEPSGYGAKCIYAISDCITRPGQWGPCSASCGGGRRSRSLIIVQEPSGYGAKCIYAISDCITRPGQWGPCSASCGGGRRSRSLIIVQEPSGYGAKCPDLHDETENCNMHPCPIDCEVEAGAESACSVSCGVGYKTLSKVIIVESQHGGLPCPLVPELNTRVQCHMPACPPPVHCDIEWSDYSLCSNCGPGTKTRTARIVQHPLNGGAPCPHPSELTETITCFERPCQEVFDCSYIAGSWGECSATCGAGYRKRSIYIVSEPLNGGKACPVDLYQREACQGPPCPIPQDCLVAWGQWSFCTRTCDGGSQTISGEIVAYGQNGGAACPLPNELTLTRSCGNTPCPFAPPRCEIIQGAQSACSVSCGGGYAYARAFIKTNAPDCPAESSLFTQVECNTQPCAPPINCDVRRSYWGECSQECGGGIQTRTLEILQHAANGGLPCPFKDFETRPCNVEPCGGYCYISGPAACGQRRPPLPLQGLRDPSLQRRAMWWVLLFLILQHAANGGLPCPFKDFETRPCNVEPCGGYCYFLILQHAANGGFPCPFKDVETRPCNVEPCGGYCYF